ncbi:MAG: phosphotransferase [Candidatus Diapherotrites archaeon]|nr:phosphotransferase [Candidatus Diapherotrites archaeon]
MQIKLELVEPRLSNFLAKYRLELLRCIAKGFSSYVFLVKGNSKKFALKIQRKDSPRESIEKEAELLKILNKYSIGPKLYKFDKENKAILMEFVKGKTLAEFLEEKPKRSEFIKIFSELLRQAALLDFLGISHGQLGGKLKNIIITSKGRVVIIDFEKASKERRAKNVTQLLGALIFNKHSYYAKIVKNLLFE